MGSVKIAMGCDHFLGAVTIVRAPLTLVGGAVIIVGDCDHC